MSPSLKDLFRGNRFEKRYDIVNHFIRTRGYRNYLEVGTSSGRCIAKIRCEKKSGVDPAPRGRGKDWTLHETTSDAFFARSRERFDIVFIDGLHQSDQVLKDIFNSAAALEPGGVILLHDCNPLEEAGQVRAPGPELTAGWQGDVWKAIACVRKTEPGLFCGVIERDQGIGIVVPRDPENIPRYDAAREASALAFVDSVGWTDLEADRAGMLGLIAGRDELEEILRREGLAQPGGRA